MISASTVGDACVNVCGTCPVNVQIKVDTSSKTGTLTDLIGPLQP